MRRRSLILGGLAAPLLGGGPASASGATTATAARPATLRLPAPRGRYALGVADLHLVDRARRDPWTGRRHRELMLTVVHPAVDADRYPLATQMAAKAAAGFGRLAGPGNYGVPAGTADWGATRTHAHRGAPAAPGRRPVVLYSPGAGDVRTWNTTLVEHLAAQGYVVVCVDHTYEAAAVEFPDGRVAETVMPGRFARAEQDGTVPALLAEVLAVRVADTRFVLDALGVWAAGRAVDAERRPTPRGLAAALDLAAVGMFGHSAGGFTAAQAMYEDARILAGVDLDGTLEYTSEPDGTHLSAVAEHGLDRPFLLMGSTGADGGDHVREPSWAAFWRHDRGWREDLTLNDSRHGSFTDAEALLPQLTGVLGAAAVADAIGTADPLRALAATRAYTSAFFDRWLRGLDTGLLNGHPNGYPVTVVP